ncbi:hypothetical protein HaLaN_10151, partial [Haematococcus lacustris]
MLAAGLALPAFIMSLTNCQHPLPLHTLKPEQQLSSQHSCLGGTGAQPNGALAWPPAPLTGTGAGLSADTHSAEDAGEGAGSWGATPGVQAAGGSAGQVAARLLQGRQEPGRGGVQPVSACAAPSATPGLQQGGQTEGTVQASLKPLDCPEPPWAAPTPLAALNPLAAAAACCPQVLESPRDVESRLYLGVHTPVDLALGAATGGSVLALWRRLGPCWLAWLKSASPGHVSITASQHHTKYTKRMVRMILMLRLLDLGADELEDSMLYPFNATQCAAYLLLHGLLLALYPRPKAHTSRSGNEQAQVLLRWLRLAVAHPSCCSTLVLAGLSLADSPAWAEHPTSLHLAKALLSKALPVMMGAAPDWLRQAWQPPVSLVSYSSGSTDAQASVFLAAKQLGQHHSEGSCCSSTDLMRGGGWGGEQQEAGPGLE